MVDIVLEYIRSIQGWCVEDSGAIRIIRDNWTFCPLTFAYYCMTKDRLDIANGWKAADYFGLSSEWLYACDFDDTIFADERKLLLGAIHDSEAD